MSGSNSENYDDIKRWLQGYGCSRFKVVNENLMCTCPFHSEENPSFGLKVGRDGKGTFQCMSASCGVRGTFNQLIQRLDGSGSSAIRDVLLRSVPRKVERKVKIETKPISKLDSYKIPSPFWMKRGITNESVERFQLGYDPNKFCATLPVFKLFDHELLGVCFRFDQENPYIPNELLEAYHRGEIPRYTYETGTQMQYSLFGADLIDTTTYDGRSELYIFEGAIDAISFHQMTKKPVVARWRASLTKFQRQFVKLFDTVYIVIDNDSKNQSEIAAKSDVLSLGGQKVEILKIDLPVKDYNEALCKGYTNIPLVPL